MKKNTKLVSLFLSVLMLCMTLLPVAALAAPDSESVNYVEIEVPLVVTATSPQTGTYGMFNAFFNVSQTEATTNMAIFDWRNTDFPTNATVTKVEVYSIKTNVPGMTYYVQVGRGLSAAVYDWAPNITWNSTVTTNYFNGQSPNAYWALRFYATRIITGPDYGAGATVSTATLRVYFI